MVHVDSSIEPDAVPALQSWLALHAGQLVKLDVYVQPCEHPPVLRLPVDKFTKLQHMRLQGLTLQLPGEEDSPVSSPAAGSRDSSSECNSSKRSSSSSTEGNSSAAQLTLPSLQHLKLVCVRLASVSSLLQLTKAPQLTRLMLSNIDVLKLGYSSSPVAQNSVNAVKAVAGAVAGMLQQLPRLSALQLRDLPFSDAAAQQTAALRGLQQVTVRHVQELPMGDLRQLPSSITQLVVLGTHLHGSPSLPSELLQLSGLLHLELSGCVVPPAVLVSLTQLQVLSMDECELMPVNQAHGGWVGMMLLLRALSKLTCLRDLELCLPDMGVAGVAPEWFSALTASSHFTRLNLSPEDSVCLPKGAMQHMFPPGSKMQSLQQLTTDTVCADDNRSDDDAWCIHSADIGRIAQACPGSQSLHIANSVEPGADLSPLLQLPGSCTALSVGGAAFTDAAAYMLAQLTQLQRLSWHFSPELTDAGLEQLLGLGLQRLHVDDCGLSQEMTAPGSDLLVLGYPPGLVSAALTPLRTETRQFLDAWGFNMAVLQGLECCMNSLVAAAGAGMCWQVTPHACNSIAVSDRSGTC
jgi:hypothetical protein